jgi:hypothetical protein
VRQHGRVSALALLVGLYNSHALRDDGGIHWRMMRENYERRQIGQQGQFTVYSFKRGQLQAWRTAPFLKPYMTGVSENKQDTGWAKIWEDEALLRRLGLIEYVPHLIESDHAEAEIMMPVGGQHPETGFYCYLAAERLALEMLNNTGLTIADEEIRAGARIVPCPAHVSGASVVGIARLRYRPKTKATAAWAARQADYQLIADRMDEARISLEKCRKAVA